MANDFRCEVALGRDDTGAPEPRLVLRGAMDLPRHELHARVWDLAAAVSRASAGQVWEVRPFLDVGWVKLELARGDSLEITTALAVLRAVLTASPPPPSYGAAGPSRIWWITEAGRAALAESPTPRRRARKAR